ncbi:MAG: hypothetical protein J6J35_01430 [Alphaproteobacteria bacterium]|nr:hypothetical protein [Alphaproteobacteria bacterium]
MSQVKKILIHESKAISAGTILTYNVPSFDTIDDIVLEFLNSGAAATKANVLAGVGKIALNINGEQVVNLPIARLYDIYAALGTEVTQNLTNCIGLNIGRYLFKDSNNEDYFAYGCADIQTIQVQVYLNSTVTGLTDCQVSTIRRATNQSLGSYIKAINYPQTMNTTGISTVDTLPRDSNEAYLSIMAHNGGGAISGGECVVNGNSVFDPISQSLDDYIVNARGLAAVSGVFNYSFSDGAVKGILPMQGVTELRLKTTFTTAPTNGNYDLVAVSIRNVPAQMLKAVAA